MREHYIFLLQACFVTMFKMSQNDLLFDSDKAKVNVEVKPRIDSRTSPVIMSY